MVDAWSLQDGDHCLHEQGIFELHFRTSFRMSNESNITVTVRFDHRTFYVVSFVVAFFSSGGYYLNLFDNNSIVKR